MIKLVKLSVLSGRLNNNNDWPYTQWFIGRSTVQRVVYDGVGKGGFSGKSKEKCW